MDVPIKDIVDLGSTGVIILCFAAFLLKFLPDFLRKQSEALQSVTDKQAKSISDLTEAFKTEIRIERTTSRSDREESVKLWIVEMAEFRKSMDRLAGSVQENTRVTQELSSKVHK